MSDEEKKKYIEELFKLCPTNSILITDSKGEIKRIYCPFNVVVINDVPGLSIGDIEAVTAIKMDIKLIDIYVVRGKAYYYFNFTLYLEK